MTASLRPATAVRLVAQRELNARLRTRGFVIGTLVTLAIMAGYVVLQVTVFNQAGRTTLGLAGQASAAAAPLHQAAAQLGEDVETRQIASVAEGRALVESGDLDALVSGSVADLHVLVKSELDEPIRAVLEGIARQEVLNATLVEAGLNPNHVMGEVASARVDVTSLEPPDAEQGQRIAIAMVMMFLLYMGIAGYGATVAQGVVEEKSSRVVEILLSSVRPWHLLLGKVLGIGLVGLVQLFVFGVAGLAMASVAGVLTVTGVATSTLLWGLLWYVLGYFLYATVFAGAGALVSRQEDMQSVVTPITIVLIIGFVAGFMVIPESDGTAATVLSLVPPLSPILMPSRIATGAASALEIGLALVLTLATIAALTWLAGRVYRAAILHTGSRMSVKAALKG